MERCHICQTEKVLKPAGVNRTTGKPYDSFLACPNYKNHQPKPEGQKSETKADVVMVLDEIMAVNKRLDKLIALLINGKNIG